MKKLFTKLVVLGTFVMAVIILIAVFVSKDEGQMKANLSNSKVNKGSFESLDLIKKGDSKKWLYFEENKVTPVDLCTKYKSCFGLTDEDSLVITEIQKSDSVEVRFSVQQLRKGTNIEGATAYFHTKNGFVHRVKQSFLDSAKVINSAKIDKKGLAKILTKLIPIDSLTASKFADASELVLISPNKDPAVYSEISYCWKAKVVEKDPIKTRFVFIDAETGELQKTQSLIFGCSTGTGKTAYNGTQTIHTQYVNSLLGYRLYDDCSHSYYSAKISTIEGEPNPEYYDSDNNWTSSGDIPGVQTHWAAHQVLDYFGSYWGRNSYDGKGGNVVCYNDASIKFPDILGGIIGGTYWDANTKIIHLGVGSPTSDYDNFNSLDVIGHEFTHGITQFDAGLVYDKESGALNESFSDIFGEAVQRWVTGIINWAMGEDRGTPIRSLSNPKLYNQPNTRLGKNWYPVTGTSSKENDYCGVHTNSGVQNYWFFLLVNGGAGTNDIGSSFNVTGIGFADAIKIVYRNLTNELSGYDNYDDAREGSINAATYYFGANSKQVASVKQAWFAVGVGANAINTSTNYTISTSVNPANGGSASGGGSFSSGQVATLKASANSGYSFKNWTENGTVLGSSTTLQYTVLSSKTIVANFTQNSNNTPTGSNCTISKIIPNSVIHGSSAFSTTPGADDLIVNGQPNCTFIVEENCSWLTVSPMSGTMNNVGQAFLNYSILANTSTSQKVTTIYVNGYPVTITQNEIDQTVGNCTISKIIPNSVVHGSAAFSTTPGADDLIVNGQPNCTFVVEENCSWLTVSPMSGTMNNVGQAFLNYSILANTSTSEKVTTIYVNDYPVTITQNGIDQTQESQTTLSQLSQNFSASGGNGSFRINAPAGQGYTWEISTSPQSEYDIADFNITKGTGPYTVTYSVEPNPTNHPLSSIYTITGKDGFSQDYTVTQDANTTCDAIPSPSTANFPASGGNGSFKINVGPDCFWNLNYSSSIIKSISPTDGYGPATINFELLPNSNPTQRIYSIRVQQNNKSYKIVQEGICSAPISPTNITASPNTINPGQSTTLQVVGGQLNSAPNWIWYSGSCGGTQIGAGATITVSPLVTTTYFVQATACGIMTTCQSITAYVNDACKGPTSPTSITASQTTINAGETTTLQIVGGQLNSAPNWNWYTGRCGGTLVGTGPSLKVAPTVTTTYYVQASACGNSTTCISITINVNPVSVSKHFAPVWIGNGFDHMNINVYSAKIDNVELETGDEIGVFDGNVCVGAGVLNSVLSSMSFLNIPVSLNDGSGNGYTSGDVITFKLFDKSKQMEYVNVASEYSNENPSWSSNGKFAIGSTAFTALSVGTNILKQDIALNNGWNILSFYLSPSSSNNLKDIFQPLIDSGKLKKVIDEKGKTIENLGVSFGGWQNSIGNLNPQKGYKINVTSASNISIEGSPIQLPMEILLNSGWNIISFPSSNEQDAKTIVQSLIDSGKLKKVIDETGRTFENLGASFGGWQNNIGNFKPGGGYKLNVTGSCSLIIPLNGSKSAVVLPELIASEYFKPIFIGNGTDHMNITIVNLKSSGFQVGDEIGVFDGKNCVGAAAITLDQIANDVISIPASSNDELSSTVNGFIPGHPVDFQLYRGNQIYTLKCTVISGNGFFEKNGSLIIQSTANITTGILSRLFPVRFKCYPNPFTMEITIEIQDTKATELTAEIFGVNGQLIKTLYKGKNYGNLLLKWDGKNDSGIKVSPGLFLCRINGQSKQIIFKGE